MAISPPSDILLDVANAADPAQVRLATARLAKLAADPGAEADFNKALSNVARGTAPAASNSTAVTANISAPLGSGQTQAKDAKTAYQKFEALLLQQFVESMLPKDDELYGDKESAGVYRSMMAEQFATQLSKAGGIGIAKAIASKHPAPAAATAAAVAPGTVTAPATAPAPAPLPGIKPTVA